MAPLRIAARVASCPAAVPTARKNVGSANRSRFAFADQWYAPISCVDDPITSWVLLHVLMPVGYRYYPSISPEPTLERPFSHRTRRGYVYEHEPSSLAVVAVGVVKLVVVPGEEVGAVVTAVGGAQDCMDVMPAWFVVIERRAGMVVELDKHNRAVNPIIERIRVAGTAEPREPGLIKVGINLRGAHGGVVIARPAQVNTGGLPQQGA